MSVIACPLIWPVLKRLYRATPAELRAAVRDLLDARQLALGQRAVVAGALARLERRGGDIADALVVECAVEAGCKRVVSFDKAALPLGMDMLR